MENIPSWRKVKGVFTKRKNKRLHTHRTTPFPKLIIKPCMPDYPLSFRKERGKKNKPVYLLLTPSSPFSATPTPPSPESASQSLPPAIIHVRLQLAWNHRGDAMLQPDVPQKSIISLLWQEKLAVAAQAWVDFAMFVEVGGVWPGSVAAVKV